MYDTVAHVVSDVLQAFGLPIELLHPEHVMKALADSLAARGLARQQSREGRSSKVVPVTLNTRDSVISAAPDMALPLYLERHTGVPPAETWVWVPPVSQSVLEESRSRGDFRCTFYQEAPTGRWHVVVTYDPTAATHRLWYYPDPAFIAVLGDPLPLPVRFAPMFKCDTIINVVPGVLMRSANLDLAQQLTSGQLQAINATLAHAQSELTKDEGWNQMWKDENHKSKSERGRMMRPLIGRGRPTGFLR